MDELKIILNIVGALGVFLFGMKIMSEALQKVAGARLKGLLARMTANRASGVLTGILITLVVQSSSATTVMVVSFVNAKLLTLVPAIGVIMGANIGTTVTGWMVALLGFKVKLTAFALPAAGLGFFMTFLPGAKRRQWGEVILGFGLLFLGLALMKNAVPTPDGGQLGWVADLAGGGFGSVLIFVAIGTGLTIVLQSSSATMTLTLTLTASGWIPYDLAAAMILGENIGTTITANLAAIGTTTAARRAARAHALFNLIGVVWALALFNLVMLPVIDWMVAGDPVAAANSLASDPDAIDAKGTVTAHLAMFHTVFNVVNMLILLPFINRIAAFVSLRVKEKPVPRRAKYITTALVEIPELQVEQGRQEMRHMAELVREMFHRATEVLVDPSKNSDADVQAVADLENQVDELEAEIVGVLALAARAATSADVARQIGEMAQNTHVLERMADHCEKLLHIAVRFQTVDESDRLSPDTLDELRGMSEVVGASISNVMDYLHGEGTMALADELEAKVNSMRDKLRERHLGSILDGAGNVISQLIFLDAVHALEEIGDRCHALVDRSEKTKVM